MGSIIEDLYDHEGYGARRLPDGSLPGTWSKQTTRFDIYVASCGCGWRGGNHPPNEDGYESAVDEWERSHARPLLAETVPAGVDTAVRDAKQAIGRLARERPAAAQRILDELGTWVVATSRRLDPPASTSPDDRMRQRLDALARQDRGEALGL